MWLTMLGSDGEYLIDYYEYAGFVRSEGVLSPPLLGKECKVSSVFSSKTTVTNI